VATSTPRPTTSEVPSPPLAENPKPAGIIGIYFPTDVSSTAPQQIHIVLDNLSPGQKITVILKFIK
jgi:hypothetical protein